MSPCLLLRPFAFPIFLYLALSSGQWWRCGGGGAAASVWVQKGLSPTHPPQAGPVSESFPPPQLHQGPCLGTASSCPPLCYKGWVGWGGVPCGCPALFSRLTLASSSLDKQSPPCPEEVDLALLFLPSSTRQCHGATFLYIGVFYIHWLSHSCHLLPISERNIVPCR